VLEDMLAVCCRVLQCGVRYSELCVAVSRVLQSVEGVEMSSASGSHTCLYWDMIAVHCRALQSLQCVALRCIALQCVALRCSAMRYVAVWCVLQCVVCCSILCTTAHVRYQNVTAS
jgi:hypothetical protein